MFSSTGSLARTAMCQAHSCRCCMRFKIAWASSPPKRWHASPKASTSPGQRCMGSSLTITTLEASRPGGTWCKFAVQRPVRPVVQRTWCLGPKSAWAVAQVKPPPMVRSPWSPFIAWDCARLHPRSKSTTGSMPGSPLKSSISSSLNSSCFMNSSPSSALYVIHSNLHPARPRVLGAGRRRGRSGVGGTSA